MTDFSFNKLVELNILPATLFIVVVATMCLGIYFKMVNFVKDKYIITILLLFSVVMTMGIEKEISVTTFLQGIIAWMASTTMYNMYKQIKKDE